MAAKRVHLLWQLILALAVLVGGPITYGVPSTWICDDGNYSNVECWEPSLGWPPSNEDPFTFEVTIPAGDGEVTMDLDACEVNEFTLGEGMTFRVPADKVYSVLDQASIAGIVHADGGRFSAPNASFQGDQSQVWVDAGGDMAICAPSYDSTGIWRSWDPSGNYGDQTGTWSPVLMRASGENSILDLSCTESIEAGFTSSGNDHTYQQIVAEDGGTILLGSLRTITGPKSWRDRIDLVVRSAGSMDLQSLSSVDQADFVASEGTTFMIPAITTLANSTFLVSGGATLSDGDDGSATYSALDIWRSWDPSGNYGDQSGEWSPVLMKVSGEGSLLDLSSIKSIDTGFTSAENDHTFLQIIAEEGGTISLAGLKTIATPKSGRDRIDLSVQGAGSSMDLQALEAITTGYHGWYYGYGTARIENAGAEVLDLKSLSSVDQVDFIASEGAVVYVPALTMIADSTFVVSGGATLSDGNDGSAVYSALDIWRSWDPSGNYGDQTGTWSPVLMKASGPGTALDLSSIQSIDASFVSSGNDHTYQQIVATNDATLDLSGVKTLRAPRSSRDRLDLQVSIGILDLSSLERILSGHVTAEVDAQGQLLLGDLTIDSPTEITVKRGATLEAKGLRANAHTIVTLEDGGSLLKITGNLELSDNMTIVNPGQAMLTLGGNLRNTMADETKAAFGQAYIFVDGVGPQELEVGGYDVDTAVKWHADDSFGFGTMIVGTSDQPTAAFLVDHTDNGNKPGILGAPTEALYLFGKNGEDGLRIAEESILYMGGLKVYALLDGAMTDLTTRFDDDELMISFDQGWLCRTWPQANDAKNRIGNGGFELGVDPPTAESLVTSVPVGSDAIDDWVVDVNAVDWTHEAFIVDSDYHEGERFVDLGNGAVSQTFCTVPGESYQVWFDVAPGPFVGSRDQDQEVASRVVVSAAGHSETFTHEASRIAADLEPDSAYPVEWQKRTWHFVATEPMTTLTFAGGDGTADLVGAMIDNVIVLGQRCEDEVCTLTLSSTEGGSVAVPGEGTFAYPCGEIVCIEAQADPGYQFVQWEVTGDCPLDPNATDPIVCVTVDGDCVLKAVFEPLCSLTLGVIGQGAIDPEPGIYYYPCGETEHVAAAANDGFRFRRWEGTAVDAGKISFEEPTDTQSVVMVTVDGSYTLTAVFEEVAGGSSLDVDPGWALEGQWEFGVPTGQRCGAWGNNDPDSGHTGSNVIGVNLDGCYDETNVGQYYATAGPFDLTDYEGVTLRFWRWLNCDIAEFVKSTVEVSSDNVTWTDLLQHGTREEITDREWTLREYAIPQADCQPTVYVRWGYHVVKERAYGYTGWNIDDVQLIGCVGCDQ